MKHTITDSVGVDAEAKSACTHICWPSDDEESENWTADSVDGEETTVSHEENDTSGDIDIADTDKSCVKGKGASCTAC